MNKRTYYLLTLFICLISNACSLHQVKKEEIEISGKPLPLVTNVYLNTFGTSFSGTFEHSVIGDFNWGNRWRTQTATTSFAYPEILTKEVKKTLQKAFENEITPLNSTRKGDSFALEISLGKVIHQTHHQVDTSFFTYNNKEVPSNTYLVAIHSELCYRFLAPDGRLIISGITTSEGKGRGADWGFSANSTSFEWAYKAAFEVSAHEACMKLVNELVTSPEINAEIRRIHILKTLPANLTADIKFSDETSLIPNNTIDAGEDSLITVSVTNEGKGNAFDVILNMESAYKNINFENTITVGDIHSGKKKEIPIPVKAGLDIETGIVPFSITCKEKRGYDSRKYQLTVPAACIDKPELLITGYKINDNATGFASGNGNGIPGNGETIEVIPFIKNNGKGKAINVNVSIAPINSNISIKRKETTIPQIIPGQTVTGNLVLSIPTTFSEGNVNINLSASDVRGASKITQLFAISTETRQPALVYTYEIIDSNKNGILENGESGELVIRTINKGQMDAKDVSIYLQSGDVKFSNTTAGIHLLPVNTPGMNRSFSFHVPRTFEKNTADISIRIEQKDFPGLTDNIHIPIKLVQPDLVITHHFLDTNNNGSIEQGESLELIIKIKNLGGLDAEDVVLSLLTGQQGTIHNGVVLNGASEREVAVGGIQAGRECEASRFLIDVRRGAETGTLPVKFTISQKDFKSKDEQLLLSIAKEQPVNITVEPRKTIEYQSAPIAPADYNNPPVIAIAFPENNKKVVLDTVSLKGTVVDDRGISTLEIKVNDHRINTAGRGLVIEGEADTNQKEQYFSHAIPLAEGRNDITVTAFDIDNLSSFKTVTVFREPKQGAIWAAVIGINHYENKQIQPLKYARNDAMSFADYLRNNWGLDENHLFELYDENATIKNIRSLLGTRLRKNAGSPEDTVFIFFAGHGAPEEDAESLDNDGITKYIISHDADPGELYATAMPMDEIAKTFSRIRAERIIFIIDSCYSGGSGGRTLLAQGGRTAIPSNAFLNRISQGKGRIIITSSNASEISQESDKLKHGYFTYYLLEGLKGKADYDGDNAIDIDEIYRYLNKHVPEATENAQHPVKKGEAEGQVVIGRIKPF